MTSVSLAAQATIFGVNLGTGVPPTTVGPYAMTAFDITTQNAIPDTTVVSQTPTGPFGGTVQFSPTTTKFSVPLTWFTWSHSYTGAVFRFNGDKGGTVGTLTLPSRAVAFYFYYEGYYQDISTVTVTTSKGGTVGPLAVNGFGGATGIGFYSDDPTDTIVSIQISSDDPAFAVAEFGIAKSAPKPLSAATPVPTLSQWSLILLATMMAAGGLLLVRRRS